MLDRISNHSLCIGIDLGDKKSNIAVLDGATGEVIEESTLRMTKKSIRSYFDGRESTRVALEVGAQSPWVTRLLEELGHEVIVANAHKISLISRNHNKSDRADAILLARLGAADPELLFPIKHRSAKAQADRATLKVRDQLVSMRTDLVNCARGLVKAFGERLPSCSATSFHKHVRDEVPAELRSAILPLLDTLETIHEQVKVFDNKISELCEEYEITKNLRQIKGVGPITALNFVLTIEDPTRFDKSREVGSYIGLRPRHKGSGKSDPELRITKAGDPMLRKHLVNCAHYIIGHFGEDTDLKRWGLKLADRGKKSAKKRAVVAVARKLAVLLHRLWVTGADYEPLRNENRRTKKTGEPRPGPLSGARAPTKAKQTKASSKKRSA